MKLPKLIEALGGHATTSRLTDKNLKLQHLYLFLALQDTNEEIKRRGLSDGGEVVLHIAVPE